MSPKCDHENTTRGDDHNLYSLSSVSLDSSENCGSWPKRPISSVSSSLEFLQQNYFMRVSARWEGAERGRAQEFLAANERDVSFLELRKKCLVPVSSR